MEHLYGCGLFLQTNIGFLKIHFWMEFLYHLKGIDVLSKIFYKIICRIVFGVAKTGNSANLAQLERDILCAINAYTAI